MTANSLEAVVPEEAGAVVEQMQQPAVDIDRGMSHLEEDVKWFMGSWLAFLFGRLALDQVGDRQIAAGVDATGRFAENFTDRGIRSYLYGQLMNFGDSGDAQMYQSNLKEAHRVVRGVGKGAFSDTRYSALAPQSWRWIAMSSVNLFYQGYVLSIGHQLDEAERAVVYEVVRKSMDYLELPSREARLPATLDDMQTEYNAIAETLVDNEFLQFAAREFSALPLPALVVPQRLHPALAPFWRRLTPLFARPIVILSAKGAHPRMRELLGDEWRTRHEVEFRFWAGCIRGAWRVLPRRLTLDPLAYNRLRYERLRGIYGGPQLDSFAVPDRASASL